MRRSPLLVLPLLLLTGCGSDDQAAPPAPPTSAPPVSSPATEPVDPLSPRPALETAAPLGRSTCDARRLRVADADLLASSSSLQEVFAVRTSSAPCQLRGWPEVTLLDAAGHVVPVSTRRVGRAVATTLSRATSVSFVLGTPRSSSCEDVATLVVRLPGTRRALRTSTTMQVCDATLAVGPVERRQDEEGSEH